MVVDNAASDADSHRLAYKRGHSLKSTTDRALAFIASEPAAWLTLMGRKVALLVNADEMLDTESQASYAEWSWPLKATGWFTHFGVLVPLAVIGGVWSNGIAFLFTVLPARPSAASAALPVMPRENTSTSIR